MTGRERQGYFSAILPSQRLQSFLQAFSAFFLISLQPLVAQVSVQEFGGFYTTIPPGATDCIYDWLKGGYWCSGSRYVCSSGYYPSGDRCIQNGYKECPGFQHTCPENDECTFAGCVPKGLADYQLCPDGRQFCESGYMCVNGTSSDTYSCTNRAQFLQEQEQRIEEIKRARRRAFALWAADGALIMAQEGIDVVSSAVTDILAPTWGGYYKGGVQAVTDVGIGEKTWDQAASDYATNSAVKYAGFSTPYTVLKYASEYERWWNSMPQ